MKHRFLAVGLLAATVAFAAPAAAGDLRVEGAWARASLGAVPNSSAYMELHNDGEDADRLTGARTPVARVVELHTHVMEGDVARMRRVQAVELPAGETVLLEPGGLHVMLIGLEVPLEAGGTLPLTLEFESGASLEIEVEVRALRDQGGGHGAGHQHGSGHGQGSGHSH